MGNPIFDWLIQREHFQSILIVAALLWVVGVAVAARFGRAMNESSRSTLRASSFNGGS